MSDASPRPRLKPCPICGKLAIEQFRPFCSKRCADIDLHRWLSGVYALPVVEDKERPDAGDVTNDDEDPRGPRQGP
ncbi:MAG TPA: DNA gyrase inhibitor YacG [Xanthobacteraceae bacterium]|nr:DNA gyrase inhibitor YacG [Xanthobacteraceae bacterium]